jgi:LmbE family N-acetylglucosaminyl deacetylase
MKILALGAHPDDIEIYMFGALAAWKTMGASLAFAIATDGSKGGTIAPAELAQLRLTEATAAAALLEVVPACLGFTDGELSAGAELVTALKQLIAHTHPDLIVTHAPNDYHGDHRALSDAVRIASSFQAPVLWADTLQGTGFAPTHYIETTTHIELKARAIRAHVSQQPERFVAMSQQLAAFRASQANALPGSYAEAYRFEPSFPFVDVRELLPPAPKVRPVDDRRNPRQAGRVSVTDWWGRN